MGVAAVSQGLVLDSAADLVERGVGQAHHMEGVSDLLRVRHRGFIGGAVGAREVQHRPADLLQPALWSPQQPARRPISGAAWHHVEKLAPRDVDDAGAPGPLSEAAPAAEQGLIEPQRGT